MPAAALAAFQAEVLQCESLIASAHRQDATGAPLFTLRERQQITVAAFLNLFIAWESFLESCMVAMMIGKPTVSGGAPTRFVQPADAAAAQRMIIGINRYFDFANIDNVRRTAKIFFNQGYPFEPTLSAVFQDLSDLRTMRNASAHLTSTTQLALEALASRIMGTPQPGIELYTLLTAPHPGTPGSTVFAHYKDRLSAAAALIAQG